MFNPFVFMFIGRGRHATISSILIDFSFDFHLNFHLNFQLNFQLNCFFFPSERPDVTALKTKQKERRKEEYNSMKGEIAGPERWD